MEFVKRAKLLGTIMEEIRNLVTVRRDRGEIVHRTEDVLDEKLDEIEKKMEELSSLQKSLLFYRHRSTALEGGGIRNPYESSRFSRCPEAITDFTEE